MLYTNIMLLNSSTNVKVSIFFGEEKWGGGNEAVDHKMDLKPEG